MSSSESSESDDEESKVFNAEGEVSLQMLAKWRKKVIAGGWWFGNWRDKLPKVTGKS